VIVQHIPPMFSKLFADRLNNECHISVKEAENGDRLENNWAYVAPGDKQMMVKRLGDMMQLDVNHGPKVNGHCPSVDVLFNSVAERIGDRAMGVILTGMGEDGARGLLKMREAGSVTLGQDEASCVVYGMPRAAYEKGAVLQQLPLSGMASMITNVARYQGRR
ncbi:MAG: chemotaxis protein CheB, partial [Selenomonadaceae bacterium]|nr:chemotaxis protein CheB [Selenomonadaceae bacterium]